MERSKAASDLSRLPILDATETPGFRGHGSFQGPRGQKASIAVEPKVSAGDFAISHRGRPKAGIGVALLARNSMSGRPCAMGLLVRILPDWSAKDGIIHLVFSVPARHAGPGVSRQRSIFLLAHRRLKAQV